MASTRANKTPKGANQLPIGRTGLRWHVSTLNAKESTEFENEGQALAYYNSLGHVPAIMFDTEVWPAVIVYSKNVRL